MTISLELDKRKIKQAFSQAALSYDSATQLQRTVGNDLLKQLSHLPYPTETLLDLGCGTGFLTTELSNLLSYKRLLAVDMALPMLQTAKIKLQDINQAGKINYLCSDAEQLPLMHHSVDSVLSNLMLQWCDNLAGVFNEMQRILKPGGYFLFTTFGPQTLQELKQAWSTVDAYRHVNIFYDADQLHYFLQQAGFNVHSQQQQLYVPYYDSVWLLMKSLKHMGAHNINTSRNKHMTGKNQLQRMINAYPKCQLTGKISASFDVFTFIAHT